MCGGFHGSSLSVLWGQREGSGTFHGFPKLWVLAGPCKDVNSGHLGFTFRWLWGPRGRIEEDSSHSLLYPGS